MNLTTLPKANLGPALLALIPLALWVALWLGLSSGAVALQGLSQTKNSLALFHGLRALLPFVASYFAVLFILAKLARQRQRVTVLFGPLGLAAVYGAVGLVSSLLSPDGTTALYWASVYLSVPLVLWATAWNADALEQIRRLLNLTWLAVVLCAMALFTVALLYLNLGADILNPSRLLICVEGGWYDLTSGVLRDTGVGRYAAIAGIVGLGGLWQRNWRYLWGIVLGSSIILLLFSGARGAMGGFVMAAAVVLFLHGGIKGLVGAGAAFVILIAVLWAAGAHTAFVDSCILRGWEDPNPKPLESVQMPSQGTAAGNHVPSAESLADAPTPQAHASLQPSSSPEPISGSSIDQAPIDSGMFSPGSASDSHAPQESIAPLATAITSKPVLLLDDIDLDSARLGTDPESPSSQWIPKGFFTLTGRTVVWREGLELFQESPLLGRGFHADRLLLAQHMHNTVLHAMTQTGILGTLPLVAAIILAWVFAFKAIRNLARFSSAHKHLIIQSAAILVLFTVRTIPESTGAFFGVDWLLLAPVLLYLQIAVQSIKNSENPA